MQTSPWSFVGLLALILVPVLGEGQGWKATGQMMVPRVNHTATLLPTGRVLVVGGQFGMPGATYKDGADFHASAELYDPATGTWRATGSLSAARVWHTATLLPSGKVLVTGGDSGGGALATAELYDPATGTWRATGSLSRRREHHTATLLSSGKVLVAGGMSCCATTDFLASAELYDPVTETWSVTGSLTRTRVRHTATLLQSGQVLVVGGGIVLAAGGAHVDDRTAELYDPVKGTFSPTGLLSKGPYSTATLLPSGKVLVVGGGYDALASAEVYDPATGSWSVTGSLSTARVRLATTPLPSGEVLVAGGYGGSPGRPELSSAELYGKGETWSPAGSLATARIFPSATLLPTGQVLVAGGWNDDHGALASAELR
jgi:hypothetical protein